MKTLTETHAQQFSWMVMDIVHGCHLDLEVATIAQSLTAAADETNADDDVVASQGVAPTPAAFVAHNDTVRVAFADESALIFTFDADGYSTGLSIFNGTEIVASY